MRDEANPSHLPVTVPDHKSIKPGLLKQILRNAGLTVEEFIRLLD
jgi:predicted RNA binding protein YcfA (HicA-like mRNA interferase family)